MVNTSRKWPVLQLAPVMISMLVGFSFNEPCHAQSKRAENRFGLSYSYPVNYKEWPNAFLSGNGKMGIMVFGNPLNETVIFNDRGFNLAKSSDRSFAAVSRETLDKIRNSCTEGDFETANRLAVQSAEYKNGGEGNRHPGFAMLIRIPEDGPVKDYSRTCNFRTGEITVKWTDNRGTWERKAFVSRPDNVTVQYLTAPSKGTVNCSIQLDINADMLFPPGISFDDVSTADMLNIRVKYPASTDGAGYEGVTRVITDGGTRTIKDHVLTITGARSVLLLTRTKKYYSDCENSWNQQGIQKQLNTIPSGYSRLLQKHLAIHQAIYDRVNLDLDARSQDRQLSNEELLQLQQRSPEPVTALWERIFDAGRYYLLSSGSDQTPPDLLGIWGGDCNAGWGGYYHLDANLNLQVSGGNIGNMPEVMEGYFKLNEAWQPDFRINAQKLLGCRGMVACGNTPGTSSGLMAGINDYYPYQYATGEEPWLLYPFWEHYLVTGDKHFLRNRLYPLLKDMGLFYEDFLTKTDKNGQYIFAGSVSPENQPSNIKISLLNNSTFDIAGARFALTALLQTCKILGVEQGPGQGTEKWSKILAKMPPYLVNSEGALQEWSWPGIKDSYDHRHSSQLMPVWPYRELSPETDPTLFSAARTTLLKKDQFNYNAGHGFLHSALIAAGLHCSEAVSSKLLTLTKSDFYYTSLATSHNPRHDIFCTDVCNTVPTVMMEMLASTNPGAIELLPALPSSLKKGSLSGMKARSQATIEKLSWNMDEHTINCTLRSDIDQSITLIQRSGIKDIKSGAAITASALGHIARTIRLKAGISTSITITLGHPLQKNLALNRAVYQSGSKNFDNTGHLVTDGIIYRDEDSGKVSSFSSRWLSPAGGQQWVIIDLGTVCRVNRAKLFWNKDYASAYQLAVSDNKTDWQTVWSTGSGDGHIDNIEFPEVSARYIRMLGKSSSDTTGLALSEFEVYGTGGLTIKPKPQPALQKDGILPLYGGNWKLQRASFVEAGGDRVSRENFNDSSWLIATVPGTVLTTYLNNGAIPDPNFGDQQLQISDAFFTADFWYRNTFVVPASYKGRKVWLNFNGINWKADIYFNGNKLGQINGAFTRGKFDITQYANPGKANYLAVLIHKNETPGAVTVQNLKSAGGNGGALGADNPTIHASIGWDWMPTIRGRNIGIQDDVYLSVSDKVTIIDPFITATLPLPDTASAALTLRLELKNHSSQTVSGTLKGTINPGNIGFSKAVSLTGNETKELVLTKETIAQLSVSNPALWWPNGYGAQHMYQLSLAFDISGKESDSKNIPFGIRQITTDTSNGILTIYVNGRRIFMRGGNWGMSESMLRLDKEGYDTRVRLHKEENFTMIRNWVGMTGDEDFYDACDKYGILIWDDFWLANPSDGPNPNNPDMFMENAIDKIKHFRNHPAIALYCGRNEGNPPANLFDRLIAATTTFDGTRPYIPHSASGLVSGFGPYSVQHPKWYFEHRAGKRLHSEMGMPNMPSAESMRAMLPADKLWPVNDMWGIHDFCNSAQGANGFMNAVNRYGEATGLEDFCLKSQMVNMENHKAMFETFAGSRSNGMLMWMSHPAWPSTVWQTYDYFLEENAGFFGCKKACEPLHILWDCFTDAIKVSNNTNKAYRGLRAEAKIYNMDGTEQYSKSVMIDIAVDSVVNCFRLEFPDSLSSTHFLRLKLLDRNTVLSDNFYWRGNSYQDYTALAGMKKVALTGTVAETEKNGVHVLTATVKNPGPDIALMIRARLLTAPLNERVLPAYYSDNYFSLLPGESNTFTIEFDIKYLLGGTPKLMVEGWNILPAQLQ